MVTITDIARRLGVAVSTVSKGLNGANDVSESTRALILKTAVEMGYAGRKVQKSGVYPFWQAVVWDLFCADF